MIIHIAYKGQLPISQEFGPEGFAGLPGAPAPDYIIPSNFLYFDGDSVHYTPYDTMTYGV